MRLLTLMASGLLALAVGCGGAKQAGGHARGTRLSTNDTHVVEELRLIAKGQEKFKRAVHVDLDNDGVGEYGWLCELGASKAPRDLGSPLHQDPPVKFLLGLINAQGCASARGHHFRMYLPRDTGLAEPEPASGGDPAPHAGAREQRWAVYAWPQDFGTSGDRCYFVNQDGKVYVTWCKVRRYSGASDSPAPGAALDRKGPAPENLDAPVAFGDRASRSGDGNVWELVKG